MLESPLSGNSVSYAFTNVSKYRSTYCGQLATGRPTKTLWAIFIAIAIEKRPLPTAQLKLFNRNYTRSLYVFKFRLLDPID